MEYTKIYRNRVASVSLPTRGWMLTIWLLAGGAAIGLAGFSSSSNVQRADGIAAVLIAVCSLFCTLILLHGRFLSVAQKRYTRMGVMLSKTEREFRSVFNNALDAILILDNDGASVKANPAAQKLFGSVRFANRKSSIAPLFRDPKAFNIFWQNLMEQKRFQGCAEILTEQGAAVVVEYTAKADFLPGRHLIVLRDVTRRQRAEEEVKRNLALARAAWSEADAIRNATLAITQDLRMDFVLDAVLNSLKTLVPYEAAQILLIEADSRLFVVREAAVQAVAETQWPMTMDAAEYPILQGLLESKRGILIKDTCADSDWRPFKNYQEIRSWVAVPLISEERTLGMLSLMHSVPESFTDEHLRLATSLAIPASVAIQNARLYERAAIYSEELERNLFELRQAKRALGQSEQNLRASDDRFEKVFRASPIAFSITTLDNGTFIDVNEAFERRYGYTRSELRARTSEEMGIWQDPKERAELVRRVRLGIPIRNVLTRLRTKSGKLVITTYSAELIQFDGQQCLLVVSEDAISSASSHDLN